MIDIRLLPSLGGGVSARHRSQLTMLHEIASTNRYELIVWFSARDIDLTASGPKLVQPQVLTDREIAEEYRFLVQGNDRCPRQQN